jgi:hypothetical protein
VALVFDGLVFEGLAGLAAGFAAGAAICD